MVKRMIRRREVSIVVAENPMEASILDEPKPLIPEIMYYVQEHRRNAIANVACIGTIQAFRGEGKREAVPISEDNLVNFGSGYDDNLNLTSSPSTRPLVPRNISTVHF